MIVANDAFSLSPNKIVFYTRFDRVNSTGDFPNYVENVKEKRTLVKQFHNFEISVNAKRNLQNKINWLFHLAKKKDIKTYAGNRIFSFRCAFLTFTLPSKQAHATSVITQYLFNHLLTVFRQRFKMANYVWRLEFQKNGNVHYHLVTDTYIDYFAALKIWNKILEANGYIAPYTEKYKNLTLSDYIKLHPVTANSSYQNQAKRYANGCKSGWKQPNTVDVKSVISKAKIAYYISKYFGKKSNDGNNCNALDNEENSKTLRLWFCSRSLSKLKSISHYVFEKDYNLLSIARNLVKVKFVRMKYAVMYFFDIQEINGFARSFLSQLLKDYSKQQGYIPSV